jgi:hypothetical protein
VFFSGKERFAGEIESGKLKVTRKEVGLLSGSLLWNVPKRREKKNEPRKRKPK